MILLFILWTGFWNHSGQLFAQKSPVKYFGGAYQTYTLKAEGVKFKVFDLNVSNRRVKAQYFGQAAKKRYDAWRKRGRKRILCCFSVGFVKDYEHNTPLGLCADDGRVLNRALEPSMDGLVTVRPGGKPSAFDIGQDQWNGRYTLRSTSERVAFLKVIEQKGLSLFQTQLLYSYADSLKMSPNAKGKKASRRLLAICMDATGREHHLVLNVISSARLYEAAVAAIIALKEKGFWVRYLLNQDTGSRDIMDAFDDQKKRIYSAPVPMSEATQLLVYYYE
ncbi:MAG: hypothetical protein AAGI38_11540 [Bacteroidota bacterium]